MSLKDTITDHMKAAMKAKDDLKLQTLRMVRSEILNMEKDGRTEPLTDADVAAKIGTLIKQRRESADQFRAGGRTELADQEEAEIAILKAYLPEEVSEDEIRAVAGEVIAAVGASSPNDFGKVMGQTLGRLKKTGKTVDGKRVNEIVRELLGA